MCIRDRGYATHAPCIQTFVAFTDTFVVFCYGEDFIVFTVGPDKYGTLDTAQELFNDN